MTLESAFKLLEKHVNKGKTGSTNNLFIKILANTRSDVNIELDKYSILFNQAKIILASEKIPGPDKNKYHDLINSAIDELNKTYKVINDAFTLYNIVVTVKKNDEDLERVNELIGDAAGHGQNVVKLFDEIKKINKMYGIKDTA